jgi:hypothetical protein
VRPPRNPGGELNTVGQRSGNLLRKRNVSCIKPPHQSVTTLRKYIRGVAAAWVFKGNTLTAGLSYAIW